MQMSSDHGSIPVMFKPAGEDLHGTVLLRFVTECKIIQGSVPPSLSPSLTAIFRILCFLIATQLTCPLSSPTVFAPLLQKVSFFPQIQHWQMVESSHPAQSAFTLRSLERSALSCTALLCSRGGRRFAVMAFSCLSSSLFTFSSSANSCRICTDAASEEVWGKN